MSKGKNVPKENPFPVESNNETTNGKDIPFNGIEYTFKSRGDSIKKAGRTVILNKDLDSLRNPDTNENIGKRVGNSLKKLRKDYGLSRAELGELVGVSDKTIEHYENATPTRNKTNSGKIDVTILIKCAEVFSSLPDKNGNYHRVSLDTLTGLTPFSSVDNELIHEQLGLNDQAINTLRSFKETDKESSKELWRRYKDASNAKKTKIPEPCLDVINFLLTSPHFRKFIELFRLRSLDMYQIPIYKKGKNFNLFPSYTTEQYDYLYFGWDPGNPIDNIPVKIDKEFRDEFSKKLLIKQLDKLNDDYGNSRKITEICDNQ